MWITVLARPDRPFRHPLGTTPKPDESLVGFLVRLAHRRGMDSAHLLSKQLGLSYLKSGVRTDEAVLARVAANADVPLADLLAISYRNGEQGRGHVVFRGRTIPARLLKPPRSHRIVCPECMLEGQYHRAAWDLSFSSACPVHHRIMVHACPDCGQRLQWNGLDLALCGCCGADLTRARSSAVSPGTLDGLRLGWGILGDDRFEEDVANACALPLFKNMPEVAILDFVYRLGTDLTPGTRGERFSLRTPIDLDEEAHMALHHGLAAAQSWPEGLERAFASVRAKEWSPHSRSAYQNWLGNVARWLNSLPPDAGHDIRDAFEKRMAEQGMKARMRPVNHRKR